MCSADTPSKPGDLLQARSLTIVFISSTFTLISLSNTMLVLHISS